MPPWDDVEDRLLSDQGIADLIIATVGAFLGAIIAFALALWIFRGQVRADKELARSERVTDAAHEIAGQLTLWAETVTMPRIGDGSSSARRGALLPMVGGETTGPVILSLVQRQALLMKAGFQESVQNLAVALTAFERAKNDLATTAALLWLKSDWHDEPPNSDIGFLRTSIAGLRVQRTIRDIWIKDFAPVIDKLSRAANMLAAWAAGDTIPVIAIEFDFSDLDTMSNLFRERLTEEGFTVLPDDQGLPF
jgi:hypothetical protein